VVFLALGKCVSRVEEIVLSIDDSFTAHRVEKRESWKREQIRMLGIYGETMSFQRLKNQRGMSILRTKMEGKLCPEVNLIYATHLQLIY